MYAPSKHFLDFRVAGLKFSDSVSVIRKISVGDAIALRAEPDNPYDPEAIALYFDGVRIGYVPALKNAEVFKLLYFGHYIFEANVIQVNLDRNPEDQIRVAIRVKDNRA